MESVFYGGIYGFVYTFHTRFVYGVAGSQRKLAEAKAGKRYKVEFTSGKQRNQTRSNRKKSIIYN